MTARRNGIPTLAQVVDLSPETLFAPPADDWRTRGMMRRAPDRSGGKWLLFPERGQSSRAAKALCAECPVQTECLAHVLEGGDRLDPGRVHWQTRRS